MRKDDNPGRRDALVGLASWSALGVVFGGCGISSGTAGGDAPEPSSAEPPSSSQLLVDDPMIGTPAPTWDVPFLGADAPRLSDLEGRVVLLRFWTDTCPFCRATAPALVAIDEAYRARGVTVVGMYHPKPRGSVRDRAAVAEVAERYGFSFPVGLDMDWSVLDAYWLSKPGRRYTSVSFVIDQRGVVRFIHPGPEFHPAGADDHEQCRADYAAVTAALDSLLA